MKGRIFKPKRGHLVLYFKNLHLLKRDQWGTNILIEFLHQVFIIFAEQVSLNFYLILYLVKFFLKIHIR